MLTVEDLEEMIKTVLEQEHTLQQMMNSLYAHRRELIAWKEKLAQERKQIVEELKDDLRIGL